VQGSGRAEAHGTGKFANVFRVYADIEVGRPSKTWQSLSPQPQQRCHTL
jgi:hypothetical protein